MRICHNKINNFKTSHTFISLFQFYDTKANEITQSKDVDIHASRVNKLVFDELMEPERYAKTTTQLRLFSSIRQYKIY